jgi:glutaredoxin 3
VVKDKELDEIRKGKMERLAREAARGGKAKVIVYSTSRCPYCQMAKQYLDGKKVGYEEVDVGADPAKAREMVEKSGQMGVPVLDINGRIIVGFDRQAMDEALSSG